MTPSQQARREWLLRVSLVGGSLFLSFVLLEGVLRLLAPGDNLRVTATADYFREHETRAYTLQPNIRRATYWSGRRIQIRTNPAGRRVPHDPAFVEMSGRRQLLIFGDSYVFGNEVNAEDTFAYLLRDMTEYDTVNLGVGGYGTRHQLDAFTEFIEAEGASLIDVVLLFFFVGNDFTDNARPMTYYSVDDDGRLLREGTTNSLLGRRLVYKSHALSFIYMRIKPLISRIKYRSAPDSYAHIYSGRFYTAENIEATSEALASFRDYVNNLNIQFAVVVIPEKDQLYKEFDSEDDRLRPNRVLGRILDDLSIPYLDLLPHLETRREESLYNMVPGGHFSVNGHRVVADLLVSFLDQM